MKKQFSSSVVQVYTIEYLFYLLIFDTIKILERAFNQALFIKEKKLTLLNDNQIQHLAIKEKMIEPYEPELVRGDNISYGPSSFGYDIRLAREFKIFTGSSEDAFIDPKNPNPDNFADHEWDYVLVPANSFVLGRSLEYIRMPRNVTGVVLGKSTYARYGIVANVTPLEAGWEGHITIEISNTTPMPVKVYALEGFIQILFLLGDSPNVSYDDRKGKYQGQQGITLGKV